MRNLKRVLSLALAAMMLMGMMVVGAGAADAKDFTDKDEIVNTEAVQILNALGVINGKEDGSYFDPTGNVTRAEMAKMITIICLGDVDVSAFQGTNTDLTDISNNWAEAYIKYCYSQGIIAGRGAGKFDPTANVTAAEAAKMLLVAIGYNADVQGYTGSEWAINVTRDAQLSGFYNGLSVASTKALTRDEAAQMIYNAVDTGIIVATPNWNASTGTVTYTYEKKADTEDLLKKTFGATVNYGYMTDVTYNSAKGEYAYTFSSTAAGADTISSDFLGSITAKVDYTSSMGMKNKMVYKTENGKTTVYGIYAVDAEKVASATGADITIGVNKVTISKVDYKTEGTIPVYTAGGYVGTLSAKNATYNYDLYDIDNDGKIELAVTVPYSVGKVTFKGNTSATIQVGASSSAYDLEDVTYYDGMAKDDFVVVVADTNTATDVTTISKLDVISGTVDATKGTSEYRIDGTWYTDAASASYIGGTPVTLAVGDQVKVAVSNGFIFSATKVNGTSVDNILYVVASDSYDSSDPMDSGNGNVISATLGSYKGVDTRVMLPDGTTSIVKAMRVDVMQDLATDAAVKAFRAAPGLYTYTVNDDGVYELKAVKEATSAPTNNDSKYYTAVAANKPSNTAVNNETSVFYVKGSGNTASTIDGKLIADDAVIYLVSTTGGTTKTKTVTGATLKTMANFGNATYDYITKTVNGMPTVIMAYLTDSSNAISGSSVDTAYGYVTSAGYYTEIGGNGVIKFTVWNGTEEVELTDVSSNLTTSSAANAKYAKGAFVTYTTSSTAGEVTGVTALTDQFAITGYDNGYNINLKSAAGATYSAKFKDDNKTVVIYVDTANVKGVEGGSIALAQEVSTGNYVMNAVAYSDGSWANGDEVSVLFVDIANKLDKAGYTVTTVTASADTTQNITLTPAVTTSAGALSSGNTVAAGSTITVTVTPSGTENTAAAYARTATVVMTRADGVTETKSVSFACDASTAINATAKSVTFTMPDMGVTSIVVSFS